MSASTSQRVVVALLVGLLGSTAGSRPAGADPRDLDVFTGFENAGVSVFGEAPDTATFTGGLSDRIGILALYHEGLRSWRTNAGSSTTIEFETPAAEVEFFSRDDMGGASITSFDGLDQPIETVPVPDTFTRGDFSSPIRLTGSIARIEIDNTEGDNTVWTDSFGYTTVPEPGAQALVAATVSAVALTRRRARQRGPAPA